MRSIKRYVSGLNAEGKSCIVFNDHAPTRMELGSGGLTDIWMTDTIPINNQGNEDGSLAPMRHEPGLNGTIFRVVEVAPDREVIGAYEKAHETLQSKHLPTDEETARHASMHKTDTLDYIVVIEGELWVMTETDEVRLQAGDCLVIRGHIHGWSNRSDAPCLLAGTVIGALPLPHEAVK